jgi:hypothetical protein
MAKKKVEKKKKKEDECNLGCGLIIAAILGAVILGVFYLCGFFDSKPKFKVGDCLVNRAYDLVRVNYVYDSLQEYDLNYLTVITISGDKWFLTRDTDKLSYNRTREFVEETYTKIPCSSKDIPNEN